MPRSSGKRASPQSATPRRVGRDRPQPLAPVARPGRGQPAAQPQPRGGLPRARRLGRRHDRRRRASVRRAVTASSCRRACRSRSRPATMALTRCARWPPVDRRRCSPTARPSRRRGRPSPWMPSPEYRRSSAWSWSWRRESAGGGVKNAPHTARQIDTTPGASGEPASTNAAISSSVAGSPSRCGTCATPSRCRSRAPGISGAASSSITWMSSASSRPSRISVGTASSPRRGHASGRLGLVAGVLRAQRAVVHLEEELARRPADAAFVGAGAVEPHPGLEPADLVDVAGLLGGLDQRVELGRRPGLQVGVRSAADGGADQQQRGDAVGVGEREIDRGPAAHRARDDDRPLQAGGVEHGQRVGGGRPAVLALVGRSRRNRACRRRRSGDAG